MKFLLSKSLLLLFCIFNLNAAANKQCTECETKSNDNIYKNELGTKVLQAIKSEFQANNVSFDIPSKMESEFESIKQFIINNFMQKMLKLNIDHISKNDLTILVQQTFNLFIKRVEYSQISKWVNEVLSDTKRKDQNTIKSSCLTVNTPIKAKVLNPPKS